MSNFQFRNIYKELRRFATQKVTNRMKYYVAVITIVIIAQIIFKQNCNTIILNNNSAIFILETHNTTY